jgi:hypothetical protein
VLERGMAPDRDARQPDAPTWARELMDALDAGMAPATVLQAATPVGGVARPTAPVVTPAPAPVPEQPAGPPAAARRTWFPGGPLLLAVLLAAVVAVGIALVVALDYSGGTR